MLEPFSIVESQVETSSPEPAPDEALLLTFRLGEGDFAIAIEAVRAVEAPGPMTTIPGTPQWLLGIANCRGELLSFVDLGAAASLRPSSESPQSRALVARAAELNCAVVVDQVTGLVRIPKEAIRSSGPLRSAIGAFAQGIVVDDDRTLVVLDFDRLLQSSLLTLD